MEAEEVELDDRYYDYIADESAMRGKTSGWTEMD